MGLDAMIFVFWMLSFKPNFSLSSFTFIKRLFSSSSLSAIRVVSSAYLRLLLFLLAILILACDSSSPAFLMMYSAYKFNEQGDNTQPWRTPFPIWNQSVFPCPVLTVASWPAYRFPKRQVRWSGIPMSFRNFHSLDPATWWTWVWVNSRNWWWTGRPGVLQFMGSQRVRHDWATDLIWLEPSINHGNESESISHSVLLTLEIP